MNVKARFRPGFLTRRLFRNFGLAGLAGEFALNIDELPNDRTWDVHATHLPHFLAF